MNDDVNQPAQPQTDDFELLKRIIECLRPLDDNEKIRLLKSAITFLHLDAAFGSINPGVPQPASSPPGPPLQPASFSARTEMSPKQFLIEKQPKNDIERVACLAYYLAHFRNVPEFNTLDISKLNTEAARPKFSNASVPVDQATRRGFLVATSGRAKQLGVSGEQFVQALPDREAAKEVLERVRLRRSRKKRNQAASAGENETSDHE